MSDDLLRRFGYHQPSTEGVKETHEEVRAQLLSVADKLVKMTPPSREQSLMLTKLEEAMFWANAGVARYQHDRGAQG